MENTKKDLSGVLDVFTTSPDTDEKIIMGFERTLQNVSPRARGRMLRVLAKSVSPCFYKKAIECYSETLATVGELIDKHGDTTETNPEMRATFDEAYNGLGSLEGEFPGDCKRVYSGLISLYPRAYSTLLGSRLKNMSR
jgi:hypothetical protein